MGCGHAREAVVKKVFFDSYGPPMANVIAKEGEEQLGEEIFLEDGLTHEDWPYEQADRF